MLPGSLEGYFIEAVSAAIHGERVRWEELPPAVWAGLFPIAEQQKLLPMLVDAVYECPNAGSDERFAFYRRAARFQVVEQARKDAAFLPICERLRQAGIVPLVVKGSLCRSVYPNGALRISADEDLLVEERCFAEACRVLSEAGLIPLSDEDPLQAAELGWKSPDGPLLIELHRSLFPPDSGSFGHLQAVFQDVFSRAKAYPLEDGASLLSLSPHDHLLFLLLHAMKHFIRTGFGLRQVCDVGLWAARWHSEVDWALLWEQTKAVHGERFCAAVFRIAVRELGIALELPPYWTEDAPDPEPMLWDLLEGGVYGSSTKSREHTARITQDAVAARRTGRRRSLRSAVFPTARSLANDYPVLRKHPILLPLVWSKRLLRYFRALASTPSDRPADTLKLGKQRLALLQRYGVLRSDE